MLTMVQMIWFELLFARYRKRNTTSLDPMMTDLIGSFVSRISQNMSFSDDILLWRKRICL